MPAAVTSAIAGAAVSTLGSMVTADRQATVQSRLNDKRIERETLLQAEQKRQQEAALEQGRISKLVAKNRARTLFDKGKDINNPSPSGSTFSGISDAILGR